MRILTAILLFCTTATYAVERKDQPLVKPIETRKVVADGRHNAFASFVKWRGKYWLAFRKGTGHVSRDGDLFVLNSPDSKTWKKSTSFDVFGDDRDAQLLPTPNRLFLYLNGLKGRFDAYVSYTDDGVKWSKPKRVYKPGYILWKPVLRQGRFYCGAHRPGPIAIRRSELVTSKDGLDWQEISTISAGRGESEATILFNKAGKLTVFQRSQIFVGGFILEANAPYKSWQVRRAGVHFSGQTAYEMDGVVYVISRLLAYKPTANPNLRRSAVAGRKIDQATMIYTYQNGRLQPYCRLGPLNGNKDSSYASVVREGPEMWVVYHRADHPFEGEYRFKDAANLYLARVPLKK